MPLLIDEVIAEVQESPQPTSETTEIASENGRHQAPLTERLEKLRERQQRQEVD
ncbi:MAG: hypothetical protein ACX936_05980 [Marinobacter sp.]